VEADLGEFPLVALFKMAQMRTGTVLEACNLYRFFHFTLPLLSTWQDKGSQRASGEFYGETFADLHASTDELLQANLIMPEPEDADRAPARRGLEPRRR
jgi:hypothetical protein